MSYSQIDRLLKKKGWSGEEVGKALIASTIHDIKHQRDPDYKPLFKQSDFDKMESSLSTERDYLTYGVYRDLYSSIIDAYNRGQGLYQQFYNGYSRYSNALVMCQNTEEVLRHTLQDFPLIMTQSEYDRYRGQAKERLQRFTESFYSVLFHVLQAFLNAPEEAPEDIRTALEATKEEKATNPRILSAYNKDYGLGYYTLPDGRRSDKLTSEKWRKAVEELFLETHKLVINGRPATAEETIQHYNRARLIKGYEIFYKGIDGIKELYKEITGEDMDGVDAEEETRLMRTLDDILGFRLIENAEFDRKKRGDAPRYPLQEFVEGLLDGTKASAIEWTYYETPPELTKHEALEDMLEHYNGAIADDVDEQTQLEEFKADYPALYSALEAYIVEKIPVLAELKPACYFDSFMSWGYLEELGIMGYCGITDPSQEAIIEQLHREAEADPDNSLYHYQRTQKAFWAGIAVLQAPASYQLTAQGDFKEAKVSHLSVLTSLTDMDSETHRIELDAYQNTLFKPALRFLYAFNSLMGIVGAVYDIDDMGTVQLSTDYLESQLEGFNGLLYMLHYSVYGDEKEKTRKRELIKELFPPVDIEELKPTQEAIDAVTAELTELGFTTKARKKLKNFDRYIAILMGEGA